MEPTLLVITGPTASGKTDLSIEAAIRFGTVIISADSRQMYREMKTGTAPPSREQLERVKHFFVGNLSIHDYYNASRYENEVLTLLEDLFTRHPLVVMTGGSMLYIDAVRKGIDDLPTVDQAVRQQIIRKFENEGLESLHLSLKKLDPDYFARVDLNNPVRIMHALEICLMTGKPYSAHLTQTARKRPFRILTYCLNMERELLYQRINQRVDMMVNNGLEEEARSLFPLRHLRALNTVGYKEWFRFFEGEGSRISTIETIKSNSRRYARKQMTWFRKDPSVIWWEMTRHEHFLSEVENQINSK